MQLIGKITAIHPPKSGTKDGKDWSIQTFLVETDSHYSKVGLFQIFNGKIDILPFNIGDKVDVLFNIESKERNGYWNTNLNVFSLRLMESEKPVDYGNASIQKASTTVQSDIFEGGNPLPF